jgi:hypothetical protein
MVTNGELAFRTSVGEVRLRPGETYTDIGAAHDTRNAAAGPASVVVTFLIRKGEPLTTFLTTAPPPASAPAIRPPATGDGGLAPDQQETVLDALFMGSLSGLALVVVAKRVHTARRGPQV